MSEQDVDTTGAPLEGRPEGDGDVATEAAAHHRRRVRAALRLLIGGAVVGMLTAMALGLAGVDGRGGAAVFLLLTTAGSALAGLHLGVMLLVDDVRKRPTSLRRGGWVLGMFTLTAALMAALAGIGG